MKKNTNTKKHPRLGESKEGSVHIWISPNDPRSEEIREMAAERGLSMTALFREAWDSYVAEARDNRAAQEGP